jgi:hypothetical protein
MNWDKLEISLLAGGALVAVAGGELGIPVATSIGVEIIALDIALVGLEGIVTKKMKWGITWYTHETYQGLAAISLGAIMLILGIGAGFGCFRRSEQGKPAEMAGQTRNRVVCCSPVCLLGHVGRLSRGRSTEIAQCTPRSGSLPCHEEPE